MSRHRYGNLGRTEKNCAFIRSVILDMHKDKTKADHYQEIFGSKAERKALIAMASRLWASPSMQEYAEEVRAEMREKFMVTVESLTEELEEARKAALGAENPQCGAAVSATMGKAKLYGLDKQLVEHSGSIKFDDLTEEDIDRRIAALQRAEV